MAFSAIITLAAAGADTGPFDLRSDIDVYATPFETGVTKANLLSGYTSDLVPDETLTVRVQSANIICTNYVDMSFNPSITYHRIFSPGGAFIGSDDLTCVPTTPTVTLFLSSADYVTWNSNGNFLAAGMVLHSSGSGTVVTYNRIWDPNALSLYEVNSGVVGAFVCA